MCLPALVRDKQIFFRYVRKNHVAFFRSMQTYTLLDMEDDDDLMRARWDDHGDWQSFKITFETEWYESLHPLYRPYFSQFRAFLSDHLGKTLRVQEEDRVTNAPAASDDTVKYYFKIHKLNKTPGKDGGIVHWGDRIAIEGSSSGRFLGIDPTTKEVKVIYNKTSAEAAFTIETDSANPNCCAMSRSLVDGKLGTREETLHILVKLAMHAYFLNPADVKATLPESG
eukprot:TRINITY_DN12532_c0_g2_i1.p2 TRINITY_DN12532_c0_g2~~TRINITY_DN12532_c0_g2_i1.p2  ORF type:complete len:226 (+),score=37.18 TRINITY_DN12532_c0_g2_i1:237-914(+)